MRSAAAPGPAPGAAHALRSPTRSVLPRCLDDYPIRLALPHFTLPQEFHGRRSFRTPRRTTGSTATATCPRPVLFVHAPEGSGQGVAPGTPAGLPTKAGAATARQPIPTSCQTPPRGTAAVIPAAGRRPARPRAPPRRCAPSAAPPCWCTPCARWPGPVPSPSSSWSRRPTAWPRSGPARRPRAARGKDLRSSPGGGTRQESVRLGLAVLPEDVDIVLVHDAARPLVPVETVDAVVAAVRGGAPAVVPALPLADTVKQVDPQRRRRARAGRRHARPRPAARRADPAGLRPGRARPRRTRRCQARAPPTTRAWSSGSACRSWSYPATRRRSR